jgi:septum site-determining protein MinD
MRNLDITLGLSDYALINFNDVIQGHNTIEQAAVAHTSISGLYLLTAPVSSPPLNIPREDMTELISRIKSSFDYCIIDAPAGIGAGFRLAASGADRAIVVATSDQSSIRSAQRVSVELEKLGITDISLVANRIEPKIIDKINVTIDDMMDTTGLPLLGVIPEDESVSLSANLGDPIILFGKKEAAVAYLHIA